MFTNAEMVAIRKFCGYGAKTASSLTFYGGYGEMEYRLTNMLEEEEAQVRDVYLANLQTLEDAILTAGANMGTNKVAVWERNSNEMAEREALYGSLRRRLCGFIGVEPGPALGGGSRVVRC